MKKRQVKMLPLIGAILLALIAVAGGVAGNLAANDLDRLLGETHRPFIIWGTLGVFLVATIATLIWAFWSFIFQEHELPTTIVDPPEPVISPPPPTTVSSALHQLPPPLVDFTGRQEELEDLLEQIGSGGVTISGLRGQGGIGKTALALVLAHQLTDQYPDVQFYLDLKGTSPDPLTPGQAMSHVIRSYEVAAQLPEDEAALQGLYYSVLQGKRALLLMDNAFDDKQVLQVIPPESCVMLVTSRLQFDLPGLYPRNLDNPSPEDSQSLLRRITPRIGELAEAIAKRCSYLPLALGLAGSALKVRVNLMPEEYLKLLEDAGRRYQEFEDVNVALDSSYQLLTPELQQFWRALSIFPDTFDLAAAAAVWNMEETASQDALATLLRYSLLDFDPDNRRYRLHDLARDFAAALLEENSTSNDIVQIRHSAHFGEVLSAAQQLYTHGGDALLQGLSLFDLERPNIEAGQTWSAMHYTKDDEAARLCSQYPGAGSLLGLRKATEDGINWLESGLAAA